MPRIFTLLCASLLTIAVALAMPPPALAQTASVSELEAAFLVNFARFTTWPPGEARATLTLCVVGDDRVARALEVAVRGQAIDGRALAARVLHSSDHDLDCQVLFVGRGAPRTVERVLARAQTRAILTVSDREDFALTDGIIEFLIEGGRMRFIINARAATRAGLRISSRLLGLAKVVYGTPSS